MNLFNPDRQECDDAACNGVLVWGSKIQYVHYPGLTTHGSSDEACMVLNDAGNDIRDMDCRQNDAKFYCEFDCNGNNNIGKLLRISFRSDATRFPTTRLVVKNFTSILPIIFRQLMH